jgi:hypothetical protein
MRCLQTQSLHRQFLDRRPQATGPCAPGGFGKSLALRVNDGYEVGTVQLLRENEWLDAVYVVLGLE